MEFCKMLQGSFPPPKNKQVCGLTMITCPVCVCKCVFVCDTCGVQWCPVIEWHPIYSVSLLHLVFTLSVRSNSTVALTIIVYREGEREEGGRERASVTDCSLSFLGVLQLECGFVKHTHTPFNSTS